MRYLGDTQKAARRALLAVDGILWGLYVLLEEGLIDAPMYRNDVARWLRLKADLLRRLGSEEKAIACERLILAQFANPDEWEGVEPTAVPQQSRESDR